MDTQTYVIAVLLALVLWQYWRISSPRNLPPGVRTVPILGSLPFLGRRLPERLTEYRSSLGDVFHVYFGRRLVIILNGRSSHSIVRYAFVYIMRLTGHTHDRESPIQNFSTAPKKLGAHIFRPVWPPKPNEFVTYLVN